MEIRRMTAQEKQNLKDAILKAVEQWSSRYETEQGEVFIGRRLEEAKGDMVKAGWGGVSGYRLDGDDCRQLGIRVERARYIGGVRKKGFAREVVYLKAVD